jgi:hypothetical protein
VVGPTGSSGSVDVPTEGMDAAPHGPTLAAEQRRTLGGDPGQCAHGGRRRLTLVVIPLVIGAIVLFALMFAIGFSEHPAETGAEGGPILLGALAIILTIEGLLLWALWRGLTAAGVPWPRSW